MAPAHVLERFYLNTHGRTEARLARWASDGDAEACFQLAVIHLLRDEPFDASNWLRRAGEAGRPGALRLRDHLNAKEEAAEFAYLFGCQYEFQGRAKRPLAAFFHEIAARCGHQDAAFRLAVIRRKSGTWS
ncbi:hypothetical protein C1I98_37985 [Spongiactinospora gelatinilytica]|uniref:Sel1 repeat family protein n=3 Tax=Spongiactinospora TaxID=2871671 RepID=A0A2W2FCK0_9ACTN|nr:hypothetical protein C1I98_37985 [Spongiactinospora gelatinilytica]